MKIDNFNKFGDTTFRVQNQLNGYISFANWYIENFNCNNNKFNQNPDLFFKRWCNEENIYKYREDDRINRFKMVFKQCRDVYKIIKYVNGKPIINYDSNNVVNSLINNFFASDNITHKAFSKMIEFMQQNPRLNNAKKISKAFFVYEEGDDFTNLYNSDIVEHIINTYVEHFDGNFHFRKPNTSRDLAINKIIEYKTTHLFALRSSDIQNKFIRKTFFGRIRLINIGQLRTLLDNHDLTWIIRQIFRIKCLSLLEGDYLDLFNRFMWGLKLSDSCSKNQSTYNNNLIRLTNGKYEISRMNQQLAYPYSLEQVNAFLGHIQQNNWNWKDENVNLCSKPNSTLAEYFVNLKFCYLFAIKPSSFRNSVNTCVTDELQPISHAPGGLADMIFKIDSKVFSIETTILHNRRDIINNERYPCIALHIPNFVNKFQKINEINLFFVNPLGDDIEIRRVFKNDWQLEFHNYENKNLIINSFKEVANLEFLLD